MTFSTINKICEYSTLGYLLYKSILAEKCSTSTFMQELDAIHSGNAYSLRELLDGAVEVWPVSRMLIDQSLEGWVGSHLSLVEFHGVIFRRNSKSLISDAVVVDITEGMEEGGVHVDVDIDDCCGCPFDW